MTTEENNNKNYDGSGGIYPVRSDDEHASIVGKFLLTGRHLRAKSIKSKNLYKLLRGFGQTFKRLEESLNEAVEGRILTDSTVMLPEWENVAGVPDACYTEKGLVENRQRYTRAKLSADGVSLDTELEWICSLLGYKVIAIPGHYFWRNPDPRVTFANEEESMFTIVFEVDQIGSEATQNGFPFTFPIVFGENMRGIMECFIETLIDSNVNGVWINMVENVYKDTEGDEKVYKDIIGDADVTKDRIGNY